MEEAMADITQLSADEKRLAELGYKQELSRNWSGFSNFAISFSIISILAGCFTNFGAGWNNGGPISISWSWPILSLFILLIGFTMSELVSAFPTSGGIYWWASRLGGPRAGFYTGWLNLIGLVAVTAGVSYGCATFIDLTISTYSKSYADSYSLTRVFITFVIVLGLASVLNIFRGHLMAIMNNVSVWWHVFGASIIVLILLFVPDQHQSFSYVFTERFKQFRLRRWQHIESPVLVRDPALRLPADAVHDHRLRRLCAPFRGDRFGRYRCSEGDLAVHLLLGRRWLHPVALRGLRGAQ
jgi:amino acid transporter